uniref:RRM domain-containing protein n=1 Tax=Anopheles epiroticus TaxID=199890 RepID=A0A182PUI6_9DIPT
MVDDATEVRVRDLPPGIPDSDVTAELGKFGEVLTIVPGVWGAETRLAGIPSGVRIVRMKLSSPIPSFITVCGEVTGVFYRGQKQTCRHCNEALHHGLSCIQNRVGQYRNNEALSRTPQSYAGAVRQTPTLKGATAPPSAATSEGAKAKGRKGKVRITSLTTTAEPASSSAPHAAQRSANTSKMAQRLIIPIWLFLPQLLSLLLLLPRFQPPILPPHLPLLLPLLLPLHEQLAMKRKQNPETDHESDASSSSTSSFTTVTRRKPGRPPKRITNTQSFY